MFFFRIHREVVEAYQRSFCVQSVTVVPDRQSGNYCLEKTMKIGVNQDSIGTISWQVRALPQ